MTASTILEASKSKFTAAVGVVNKLSFFFLKERRFISLFEPATRPGLSAA
jgi:hypothetical protein